MATLTCTQATLPNPVSSGRSIRNRTPQPSLIHGAIIFFSFFFHPLLLALFLHHPTTTNVCQKHDDRLFSIRPRGSCSGMSRLPPETWRLVGEFVRSRKHYQLEG